MHITGRIDALLKLRGISKTQFYKDCGITSAAFSLWKTQKTVPSMKNLTIIAEYLDTTVGYLLDGIGKNETKELPDTNVGEFSQRKRALIELVAKAPEDSLALLERLIEAALGDS